MLDGLREDTAAESTGSSSTTPAWLCDWQNKVRTFRTGLFVNFTLAFISEASRRI